MAIQIPNPGTGNGATGDNEFVLWTKVKDNFSNQTHAASREIGATKGKVALADNVIKAFGGGEFIPLITAIANPKIDINSLEAGTIVSMDGALNAFLNQPPIAYPVVATVKFYGDNGQQTAWGYFNEKEVWFRTFRNGVFSPWVPMSQTLSTYKTTTAAGANVVVDTDGKLTRATSSEKYKDVLGDLVLTDERYEQALQVKPIVYRSLAEADPESWHFLSFSAEELGAYDPAFTFWKTHETDLETGEKIPLLEKQAEGINLNAITAMLHATNIKQGSLIKDLQEQINALKPKSEV